MTFTKLRAAALLTLAIGSIGALSACGGDDNSASADSSNNKTTVATAPTTSGSSNSSKEATEVKVVMHDNTFDPAEITVNSGAPVKFEVKNEGTAIHNMSIQSQAGEGKNYTSDAIVKPGGESTFEVTFTKPGTYDFQCDYHVPDMVGMITVK